MPALAAPAEETRLAGRAAGGLPELASFRAAFSGYEDTRALDGLRASEYWYLDAEGQIYLDYTGAGLPAQAQLSAHAARLHGRCFGNPHSENPTSAASTALIDRTRRSVLDYFSASDDEYAVIFTPNASAACRLVGEAYPFGKASRLVLTSDNHNSVNGIREFALARGAATEYVPFRCRDLRVDEDAVRAALRRTRPRFAGPRRSAAAARRGLFAFPAQSNFSGVRHPLSLVDVAHEHGYDVLLDAAAYVPTRRLDLSAVRPDFVPVSWYKMFGYPTGVGCLIARRDALARLRRPWFAGGTISAVSVQAGWHALAGGEAAFEDGTPSFLQIPDVEFGLSWIRGVGIDVIGQRVACLTGWMLNRLAAMRHGNGQPMARIHGPADTRDRGGTVAFNLLDPRGRVVDARTVARDAAAAGISVRTGCFCNPGAAEAAFRLGPSDVARGRWLAAGSTDRYMEMIGVPGGAIRASVGLASTIEDVQTFLTLLHNTYRDRLPPGDLGDLPAQTQRSSTHPDRVSGGRALTPVSLGRLGARMTVMGSYVERPPLPGLAGVVRTVWIQCTGEAAYVQRHLPTGGVEIHFPIGGHPQLVGPLTGPEIEVIPARTTIVGVRFQPGTAPPLPTVLDDLVDQRLGLAELWGSSVDRLVEAMARAGTPERALMSLQAHLVQEFRCAARADPLVGEAVKVLMPWHPVNIDTLATHLALSASQLRRRCLHAVGVSPKVLQRALRFQGFLALAQAGAAASGRRGADGIAGLAVDAGYADQAHLSRECLRLTGLTPGQLLGGSIDRCACGHDHAASYKPFLATRSRPPLRA